MTYISLFGVTTIINLSPYEKLSVTPSMFLGENEKKTDDFAVIICSVKMKQKKNV